MVCYCLEGCFQVFMKWSLLNFHVNSTLLINYLWVYYALLSICLVTTCTCKTVICSLTVHGVLLSDMRFLLVHDSTVRGQEAIRGFFNDVYELFIKVSTNEINNNFLLKIIAFNKPLIYAI